MSSTTAPWIPTADRLPEEPGFYLTTVLLLDPIANDGSQLHSIDISYFNTRHRWSDWDPEDVIAWMPLPEPYNS